MDKEEEYTLYKEFRKNTILEAGKMLDKAKIPTHGRSIIYELNGELVIHKQGEGPRPIKDGK